MKQIYKAIFILFFILISKILTASNCIPAGTTVTLNRQSEVDSFPINYPGCDVVDGSLVISGNDIVNLNGLSNLKLIGDALVIKLNPNLVNLVGLNNIIFILSFAIQSNNSLLSLGGLHNLEHIGYFFLENNDKLVNFSGLNKLKTVSGFNINDNDSLKNFEGLDSLNGVYAYMNIFDNSRLLNFVGLKSLRYLDYFSIYNNNSLINFVGLNSINQFKNGTVRNNNSLVNFDGLENVDKFYDLLIHTNNSLQNFFGLNNVKCVGGSLVVQGNTSLVNFTGFNNIKNIKILLVEYNSSLVNFTGLNNLDTVSTFFRITNNSSLKNLEGLQNFKYIGNSLKVTYNTSLCSINQLNKNLNLGSGQFEISSNPNLNCCKITDTILNNNPTFTNVYISNNAPGCNDTTEIRTMTTQTCCSTKYTSLKDTICNGNQFIFNNKILTVAGIYHDTIIVGNVDSIIVFQLTVRPKSYQVITKNLCIGQSFTLSNGKVITTNGIYKDTIPNVCDSIIEYRLTFLNNITTSVNASICKGKAYTLPKGNVVSTSGIYKDTLLASFGCDSIIITNLTVNPYLQFAQTATVCLGKSYVLPSGKNVNQTGIYKDTIKNLNACDSIIITNLTITNPVAKNINVSICDGQTYILPNGKQVSNTGIYTDTIRKSNTCDSVVVTNLNVFLNTFNISLNPIDSIDAGSSIELKPFYSNQIASIWNWIPATNLSCNTCERPMATPTQTTKYIVNAKALDGCEDTAVTTIVVKQTEIYIPTAFSPNNDGVNDYLDVFAVNPKIFSFKIYNRYGELVFQSNDINIKWNGTCKDENCEVDNYNFVMDATQQNGKQIHQQGVILLVR